MLRLCLSKEGPARFISHLDYSRAVERALRRAGIPVQFTQGFNPRMKVSFADALPLGMTSEAEWLDVHLRDSINPSEAAARLNATLPPGMRVLKAIDVPDKSPTLASQVQAIAYEATVRFKRYPEEGHGELIRRFLARDEVTVKSRERMINVRGAVLDLDAVTVDGRLLLHITIAAGKSVRPEAVIRGLDDLGGGWLELDSIQVRKTRTVFRDEVSGGGISAEQANPGVG